MSEKTEIQKMVEQLEKRGEWRERKGYASDFFGEYEAKLFISAAALLTRQQEEIAELARRLGGGCDANGGGQHTVIKGGTYSFCGGCGESLRGIHYCHDKRADLEAAALQAKPETLCEGCPPAGYPTDKTRCEPCPRRTTRIASREANQ